MGCSCKSLELRLSRTETMGIRKVVIKRVISVMGCMGKVRKNHLAYI